MNPPQSPSHPLLSDPAFSRLKDRIIGSTGLAYYADKDAELAGRVMRRLGALGLRDCASFLALLEDDPGGEAELDALIEELTIGETFFFRHREMFDALRDTVLPERIERNRSSRRIRIWSAGCSTGTEPYSVALLLKREFPQPLLDWDITILGTDVNRRFLAQAQEGRFEEWALRSTPDELKRACFSRSGNSWVLRPEYREGVSFQYHNLVAHPFPSLLNNLSAFDIILCRNVTIYFGPEVVRRLVAQFHQSLVDGGWLLVGHAEPNTELYRCFRTVNFPGGILYQKGSEQAGRSGCPAPGLPTAGSPSFPWFATDLGVSARPRSGPKRSPRTAVPTGAATSPPVPQPARGHPELATVRAFADRGEWERAAACCQELLGKERLNPVVHFYQALVLEQTGAHVEAERALRRAIYLNRHFVLAHYYLGLLTQRKGQSPEAARLFRNVLRLLARTTAAHSFPDGDGISADDLKKLTQMHLEILEAA